MKKILKGILVVLLFAVLLVPSFKASAAIAPAAPQDLKLTMQSQSDFIFSFDYDSNIVLSTDINNFGYELVATTLKNKKLKTVDLNIAANLSEYLITTGTDAKIITNILYLPYGSNRMNITFSSGKMASQPFKVKIRAYTYDATGAKVYGDYSAEKTIVPRASIKSFKAKSKSTGTIKWKKIKGAKSYTVYVSTNGGTKYKKRGTTKGTSFTVKSMKLWTRYPVYVVANGVKVGKKKISSTKPEEKSSNASSIMIKLQY